MTPLESAGCVAGGGLLALLCLFFAFRVRARERLLEMLPTVKTQGVFIGFVELKGTAEVGRPLTSVLAGQSCVDYRFRVEEHWSRTVEETYTDSEGRTRTRIRTESGWAEVARGGEGQLFYLRDDTGVIRINPEGAKIEPIIWFDQMSFPGDPLYYAKGPPMAVADSDHRRRFVEEGIPVGAPLYVVGQSRERRDQVAPEIAKDPKAPMFLISTRSEQEVERGMGWASWGLALLGLALACAGVLFGLGEQGRELPYVWLGTASGAFFLAWVAGWTLMAYNLLVGCRQRVRQAASLVDIELLRRHDLIPNLVAAVQGFRDHEANLQQELAAIRSQAGATRPGRPGPDPSAILPSLRVIAERYPQLQASESFLALQKSLSETEQRIAMARDYFNGVATGYNIRLEVVPDRFVASLARLRPETLFSANGFERVPVKVDLAEPDPVR